MASSKMASDGHEIRPVRSILDSDLYKFTMQQAILLSTLEDPPVSYRFTNRSKKMKFTRRCVEQIQRCIDGLSQLALSDEERNWLATRCPYFREEYLSHLAQFRFRPKEQVELRFVPDSDDEGRGDIELSVQGKWSEVILYEVPLMSIVSEMYFRTVDTDWTMEGQRTLAKEKARRLVKAGIRFSEFGSRRRRSYDSHKYCIEGLMAGQAQEESAAAHAASSSSSIANEGFSAPSQPSTAGALGKLLGTSNVHFAQLYDLTPMGTVAHEWTMAIAALEGYDHANLNSLQHWDQVYSSPSFVPNSPAHDLTIALTDTFSTSVFFGDLLSTNEGKEIAMRWRGLRQDSGDSKAFARRARDVYNGLGVDPRSKVVIYSDGLDVDRCVDLQEYSTEIGIGAGFGIGTFLTNDFRQSNPSPDDLQDPDGPPPSSDLPVSKPLNIVIKLSTVKGRAAVKISDELTKNTGDAHEIEMVKRRFGLTQEAMQNGDKPAGVTGQEETVVKVGRRQGEEDDKVPVEDA